MFGRILEPENWMVEHGIWDFKMLGHSIKVKLKTIYELRHIMKLRKIIHFWDRKYFLNVYFENKQTNIFLYRYSITMLILRTDQRRLVFFKHQWCACPLSTCFTYVILYNLPDNSIRWVCLFPFYRWRDRDAKKT